MNESNSPQRSVAGITKQLAKEYGLPMKDLTVLSPQRDPFRVDTDAGHRDGEWLAEHIEANMPGRTAHLRAMHYALVGAQPNKPNGLPYTNTDPDWIWMSEKAAKAARWLGKIDFNSISDQRNAAPTVIEHADIDITTHLNVGIEIEIPDAEDLMPTVGVEGFVGRQPYRMVMVGEKSSLVETLEPIAARYRADLYLPTGEISDTLIHRMASDAAEDGRPLAVFYFSDCDPAGYQMPISLSWKLQALRLGWFPALDFEVVPVGVLPQHVREYGLPSTPVKKSDPKAEQWRAAMGIEQTELDALLAPQFDGLLEELAEAAMSPYFDQSLDRRVAEARSEWLTEAQIRFDEDLGDERLAVIRTEALDRVEALEEQVAALNDELRVEMPDIDMPDIGVPEPDIEDGMPEPMFSSAWSFDLGTAALKERKSYENGGGPR